MIILIILKVFLEFYISNTLVNYVRYVYALWSSYFIVITLVCHVIFIIVVDNIIWIIVYYCPIQYAYNIPYAYGTSHTCMEQFCAPYAYRMPICLRNIPYAYGWTILHPQLIIHMQKTVAQLGMALEATSFLAITR